MSKPDDRPDEALERLGEELKAFEATRAQSASSEASRSIGEGYRLMAELIGGVFGGAGLGWLADQFAHTTPWGLGLGLAAGAGVSVYMAARTAARMGRQASAKLPPATATLDDDDED
jgi:ATP synthase protein I